MPESKKTHDDDRRQFIKGATCVIGGAIGLVPTLAAVRLAMDPIGRKRDGESDFTRLANLDELEPGKPAMVPVIAEKRDKWSKSTGVVGAVWLLRENPAGNNNTENNGTTKENTPDSTGPSMKASPHVTAFSTICPHLGCFVDYRKKENDFYCPCHNSKFDLTGIRQNATPPRNMDELDVDHNRLSKSGEVWVKYVRYKTNRSDRVPA